MRPLTLLAAVCLLAVPQVSHACGGGGYRGHSSWSSAPSYQHTAPVRYPTYHPPVYSPQVHHSYPQPVYGSSHSQGYAPIVSPPIHSTFTPGTPTFGVGFTSGQPTRPTRPQRPSISGPSGQVPDGTALSIGPDGRITTQRFGR